MKKTFILMILQWTLIAVITIAVIKLSFKAIDYVKSNGLKSVVSEIWEGENNGD